MKKTLAVVGASVLGVAGVVASPMPAQAAPVTDACSTSSDHGVTNGTLADNWYMDCVPQYGLGKVDFNLTADEPLPADLLPLEASGVTSSATTGAAASTYFGATGSPAGFTELRRPSFPPGQPITENAGYMVFPIQSVQSALLTDLPAGCTDLYSHAYRVDYGAAAVTFSQTVGTQVWTWTVNHTPVPVYLGVNFLQPDPGNPDPSVAAGAFDPAAALCASNGAETLSAVPASANWSRFASLYGAQASLSPIPLPLGPFSNEAARTLGAFNAVITATPPVQAPAAAPEAELAATGAVPSGVPLAGGLLLAVGVALTVLGRTRRSTT